jgi:RNA-directed DNA polymerase
VTPMICTKAELSELLQVALADIDYLIGALPRFYRSKSESKPHGQRVFYIPQGRLRKIQDKIRERILSQARFSPDLHGGIKGRSALTNVRSHRNKEAVLALDIKDFFPSIRPNRVLAVFERLGYDGEAARILTRLTTYEYQLPQGAPTSTAIANLCIPRIDARLGGIARVQRFDEGRFVDDMTVSGSKRLAKFARLAGRIVEEDGFSVKQGPKGKLMFQNERQTVTGLGLNFRVNVERGRRQEVLQEAVENLKLGSPVNEITRGRLGWVKSANPRIANRLANAVRQRAKQNSSPTKPRPK